MPPVRLDPSPVFLYFDPHPVHEKMASYVGAEAVQCDTGAPSSRVRSAWSHDFGDRPVLLEGGVPLFEGAVTDLLGNCGPVIALGADSTYDDLVSPLPNRSRASRFAHRVSQFVVDGTLAVSERIATIAERYAGPPVRIVHPFVEDGRRQRLRGVEPDLGGSRVLCVGKYRDKNGQDLLRAAIERVDADVTVDFVGPDTESIEDGEGVRTHGFVSEKRLVELFDAAALSVFPAPVGAFPVATLEALCAGLPVVVTPRIGTATLVRGIHGRLVADPTPAALAESIDWYFGLAAEKRRTLADRAEGVGSGFTEDDGLEAFRHAFVGILDDLGYDITYRS